jgi:hypothetical protein
MVDRNRPGCIINEEVQGVSGYSSVQQIISQCRRIADDLRYIANGSSHPQVRNILEEGIHHLVMGRTECEWAAQRLQRAEGQTYRAPVPGYQTTTGSFAPNQAYTPHSGNVQKNSAPDFELARRPQGQEPVDRQRGFQPPDFPSEHGTGRVYRAQPRQSWVGGQSFDHNWRQR